MPRCVSTSLILTSVPLVFEESFLRDIMINLKGGIMADSQKQLWKVEATIEPKVEWDKIGIDSFKISGDECIAIEKQLRNKTRFSVTVVSNGSGVHDRMEEKFRRIHATQCRVLKGNKVTGKELDDIKAFFQRILNELYRIYKAGLGEHILDTDSEYRRPLQANRGTRRRSRLPFFQTIRKIC